MANQNKIQVCLDDETYEIIKKLKPRTLKLFVSVAIEEFSQRDESKLFFKNQEPYKNIITDITHKIEEVKKTSSLQEWD